MQVLDLHQFDGIVKATTATATATATITASSSPTTVPHSTFDISLPQLSSTYLVIADNVDAVGGEGSSWRQYVLLVVSSFVILDIVLGSPFVNTIMKPLRDASMDPSSSNTATSEIDDMTGNAESTSNSPLSFLFGGSSAVNTSRTSNDNKKARIDTDRVAQDAINRAQNALELQNYLESRKSDWDRMEDMKKSLDKDMKLLDRDLQAKQKAFDTRND